MSVLVSHGERNQLLAQTCMQSNWISTVDIQVFFEVNREDLCEHRVEQHHLITTFLLSIL